MLAKEKNKEIEALLCNMTSNLACLSGIPVQHLHGEPQVPVVIVAVEGSLKILYTVSSGEIGT